MKVKRITQAHQKRELVRLTKKEIESGIEDIAVWLSEHSSDHPQWREKVSEMNALSVKLECMGVPYRRDVYDVGFRVLTG